MSFQPAANTGALSASTTSSTAAIPLPGTLTAWSHEVLVSNTGTAAVFVAFGASAVTVVAPVVGSPANGISIPAGTSQTFSLDGQSHIGVLAASGTNLVYFTAGVGSA